MPTGTPHPTTKDDLRERIKQIEERIKEMDRRDKVLEELKVWVEKHRLTHTDVLAMYRMMKPQRADRPVKSKMPLQPQVQRGNPFKPKEKKGDPEFRAAIKAARLEQKMHPKALAKKVGVSPASIDNWESGRNVPKDGYRLKILKLLDLPLDLGAAASAATSAASAHAKHE